MRHAPAMEGLGIQQQEQSAADPIEPLGSAAALSAKYNFIANGTVNGQVYGIAQNGNARTR